MKAKGGLPRTWQEFSKFVEDNRIEIIRRLAASVNNPGLVNVILQKRPPAIHPWDPIKGVQNATKTLEAGRHWAEELRKADNTRAPAPTRTAPIVPAPARSAPIVPAPARTTPTSSIIFGLDTYSGDRNANPNWAQAKALVPIHFAIIKSNEGLVEDSAFKREWPRLKDAGIVRGAYVLLRFPHPGTGMKAPDPAAQARAFIKTVGGLREPDLPPSLDVEFPGDKRYPRASGGSLTGMNERQLLAGVYEAWKVLKNEYGVAPIIYTSARVWLEDLKNIAAPQLVESPLWLAKPWPVDLHAPAIWNPAIFAGGRLNPKVPPPWGDSTNWWIHQYQGDADITRLPGFRQVDMNRFNPMLLGATGHRVRWVQRRLGIAQNGQFDSAMDGALRAFKARKGLESETGVGLRTFVSLCWSNP
jgi:GH25 family lysozyme M1 (1,4-beta-N-acetylmuramidase)